ncbi:MAG: autotransporter outer membrane beta-barrel domain-containing protein, partial [Abditibacteriaceae bacterium]
DPNIYNNFLGDSYSAFDTAGYFNVNNFINSIATHARQSQNNDWTETFALNAQNGLGGVGAQMSLVSQLLDSHPVMALSANGNDSNGSDSALWGNVSGNWLRNDSDSTLGSPDWTQNTSTVNIGYQGGSDSFHWGITGGYHTGNIDFNNRAATGKNDGWNLGLNGLWQSKSKIYVNGVLTYGHDSNSFTRNDGLGINQSSFGAKSYAGMLEIGKRIDRKTYNFTPYASILGMHYDRDGATETGTGVGGLSVDSESHSYLTSALGVRLGKDYLDASGQKRGGAMLDVSWQHQFSSTDFPVTASLNGAMGTSTFTTYGSPLASDSVGVQMGAYAKFIKNIYGFLNYSGNFSGDQKINSITAGLQYGF